jgi:hypothetical protein
LIDGEMLLAVILNSNGKEHSRTAVVVDQMRGEGRGSGNEARVLNTMG